MHKFDLLLLLISDREYAERLSEYMKQRWGHDVDVFCIASSAELENVLGENRELFNERKIYVLAENTPEMNSDELSVRLSEIEGTDNRLKFILLNTDSTDGNGRNLCLYDRPRILLDALKQNASDGRCPIIAFMGISGGSGCTYAATLYTLNLLRSGERTAFLSFDRGETVFELCGMIERSGNRLAGKYLYRLRQEATPDTEEYMLTGCDGKLAVFDTEEQDIRKDAISYIIDSVTGTGKYRHIVIDTGTLGTDELEYVMNRADCIICTRLNTNPYDDTKCNRVIRRLVDYEQKTLHVINRTDNTDEYTGLPVNDGFYRMNRDGITVNINNETERRIAALRGKTDEIIYGRTGCDSSSGKVGSVG